MNIKQIAQKVDELERRVTAEGYTATPRDLAEAQELVNQYIDELERLERIATVTPYLKADDVANKIMRYWHG